MFCLVTHWHNTNATITIKMWWELKLQSTNRPNSSLCDVPTNSLCEYEDLVDESLNSTDPLFIILVDFKAALIHCALKRVCTWTSDSVYSNLKVKCLRYNIACSIAMWDFPLDSFVSCLFGINIFLHLISFTVVAAVAVVLCFSCEFNHFHIGPFITLFSSIGDSKFFRSVHSIIAILYGMEYTIHSSH